MTAKSPPLQLLSTPAFLKVWVAGGLVGIMRWLDVLAVGVYVFAETHSPLNVALTLFLRTVPMLLFGVVSGGLAERFDRRKLLIGMLSVLTCSYAGVWWLAYSGQLRIWHLGISVFLSGLYWAMELPTRRTIVADIAGIQRISAAMGLESSTMQCTRMIGPFVGGYLYELYGIAGTLFLGAFLHAISTTLIATTTHHTAPKPAGEHPSVWANIAEGLRYVRTTRAVLATLIITVMVNLFGFSYTSMVPVIARDVLNLSPFPTGWLMSAEGLGAMLGSLWVAFFARPPRFNQIYFTGACIFLTAILTFSLSTVFAVSLPTLWVGGFGIAGFGAMQSSLIISNSAPEMRNRVMGVLSMSIGMGPIGVLTVGLLADSLGPTIGIMISSATGLVVLALCAFLWPELIRKRPVAPQPG